MLNIIKKNIGLMIISLVVASLIFLINVFIIPYSYTSHALIEYTSTGQLKEINYKGLRKYINQKTGLSVDDISEKLKLKKEKTNKLRIFAESHSPQLSKKLCDYSILYFSYKNINIQVIESPRVAYSYSKPHILRNTLLSFILTTILLVIYNLIQNKF